jgi:hypothetical protein
VDRIQNHRNFKRDKLKRQGDIDMKRFSIPTLMLASVLIVSACGARATPPPTLSVVDLQSTAAAVALTMFAGTQAAIPTATPIPPTETPTNTPLPTMTELAVPTSNVTSSPLPNSNTGGGQDPCINRVLPSVLEGRKVKIRLDNSTKVAIALTVYLNQTVPVTECGYRAYTLEPGGSLVITDMVEGCYTLWAWNPDQKNYFIVTNGASSCIDNTYPVTFDITTRDIRRR